MEHQLSSQQLEEGNLVNIKNAKYLMRLVTILPPELESIKRLQDSICTFAELESHHDPSRSARYHMFAWAYRMLTMLRG